MAAELGAGRPSGGLAESAIGDEGQALRRDARLEDRLRPLGDLVRRFEVVVLDVDDAGGDVATGSGDLAEDLDLGHLAVRELEDQFVHVEPEHRIEDGPVGPSRQRPAQVIAEAEVGAEAGPGPRSARRRR